MDFSEIAKRKWITVSHAFTSAKVTFLDGFSGDTNPNYHNIAIVTEKKKLSRYFSQVATIHTIEISGGAFGENGTKMDLPKGTSLKEAKMTALGMVRQLIEMGVEFKA